MLQSAVLLLSVVVFTSQLGRSTSMDANALELQKVTPGEQQIQLPQNGHAPREEGREIL